MTEWEAIINLYFLSGLIIGFLLLLWLEIRRLTK